MIAVEEALKIILDHITPLGLESIDILGSVGRILGEDERAGRPNPPWDNSAMDGYALKAEDTSGASKDAPTTLKVIYDLPAGHAPKGEIKNSEAVRIMTGAPIPPGADAVIMVESTALGEDGFVRLFKEAKKGDNIRKKGEDFNEGEIVLKKGSLIRPAEVLMLATIGRAFVFVHKRPRVAVISTGDELTDIGVVPKEGHIINSNGYAIAALVKECGAEAVNLGIARDTKESLREKLMLASSFDCIISSGGVSVGDYDFVKDVLKDLGSEMKFWKVAMKPGKPLAFGVINNRPAFGLPGNPISSMVAFEEFAKPALLKMAGRASVEPATFKARITEDLKIKPGRKNFIRAILKIENEGFSATPLSGQGSGIISTMVKSNSFIVVPAASDGYKKDALVPVEPIDASILFKGAIS